MHAWTCQHTLWTCYCTLRVPAHALNVSLHTWNGNGYQHHAHSPLTLADDEADVAINTVPDERYTIKPVFLTRSGWIKLSLLPLSNKAVTWNPFILTIADDLERDSVVLVGNVASKGDQVEAETLLFWVDWFALQTLVKWPFFEHFKHVALRAGHLEHGCLLFPQKKQVRPFTCATATVLGSCCSAKGVVGWGTAALMFGCGIVYNSELLIANSRARAWSNLVFKSNVLFSSSLWWIELDRRPVIKASLILSSVFWAAVTVTWNCNPCSMFSKLEDIHPVFPWVAGVLWLVDDEQKSHFWVLRRALVRFQ